MTSAEQPAQTYSDRVFRSPAGIASGVLLLVIALWVGGDALFRGVGRTPWLALAGLVLAVPLVAAFTVRPAVFAGADELRIRNPFRVISVPWAAVKDVRAGYSTEVIVEGGGKFSLWAVPVSLRQRKRAQRRMTRQTVEDPFDRMSATADAGDFDSQALADRAAADLRELAERSASRPTAQGPVRIRWAYEIVGPVLAGLVVLVVLLATG